TVTGLPAISVPCGFTASGLPVGLQIVGRRHQETMVLRAAAAFEAAAPWAHRIPPTGTGSRRPPAPDHSGLTPVPPGRVAGGRGRSGGWGPPRPVRRP